MLSLKHLLPVAFMAVAAPAVAQDMQFELINTSGYTLMEFYASPSDVGSWDLTFWVPMCCQVGPAAR